MRPSQPSQPHHCILDGHHAVQHRGHSHDAGPGVDQLLLQQPCEGIGAQVVGLRGEGCPGDWSEYGGGTGDMLEGCFIACDTALGC